MVQKLFFALVGLVLAATWHPAYAQSYTLPDMLRLNNGTRVTNRNEWEEIRRAEILKHFEDNVYGQLPRQFDNITYTLTNTDPAAMGGTARLKQVRIRVTRNGQSVAIDLVMFVPNAVQKPGVFLLINHRDSTNTDPTRTIRSNFWPAEQVVASGYAIAAFQVADVAPDNRNTFASEVLSKLYPEQLTQGNGMRAIGAWAWGASRVMDYLLTDTDIDRTKVAVLGHSRGGKAALWCGAQDQRFALTISNNSGRCGAALFRRRTGESVESIRTTFPYWFCPNFNNYTNANIETLPVDTHELIGLMAPRPVYVASASQDPGADPQGEFEGVKNSEPAFALYGIAPMPVGTRPPVNTPVTETSMGYHLREGGHGLTLYDWQQFINFANYHFRNRTSAAADAFVRDGSFAGQNYGTAPTLDVKSWSASAGFSRNAYLRFPLSANATVGSATLRLYARHNGTAPITTSVRAVADVAWPEVGITWVNQPALGSSVGSLQVAPGNVAAWYEVDVTAYVRAQLSAGQGVVCFGLQNPAVAAPVVSINSREAFFNQPQLLISSTPPGSTTRYEAEQASLSGGTVVASGAGGYTGTGFVDYSATGGSIDWAVQVPAAGTYRLTFRYANGSGRNRPLSLSVNSTVLNSALAFTQTANWSTWNTTSLTASLTEGTNRIQLSSTTEGPNVDYLEVSSADITQQAQPAEADLAANGLRVYPNPAQDLLTVQLPGEEIRSIELVNSLGKVMHRQTAPPQHELRLAVDQVPAGLYLLRVHTLRGASLVRKVLVQR